ncbi:MAG: ribonuclease J [Saccharofermentanales bacterium]|jgi:ribonuclease J|nr:ribonuclease J [Bacillota bacterium]
MSSNYPIQSRSSSARSRKQRAQWVKDSKSPGLRIIPLGGLREVGKNMTCFQFMDDLIIVDCGLAFPDEDMPGVDIIIPDFSYVRENKDKLRAIFITHGHEDHIGALPWFLKEFNVPVYGDAMTIKLVERKLKDRSSQVKDPDLRLLRPGQRVGAGHFQVESIHVNHSIADSNAFAITTPLGVVLHTGDFKIDYTPPTGTPINLSRIAELGRKGILALISDSTNIEVPGSTMSELAIGEKFKELFAKASGRVFVATFSSNVYRLQQVIDAAEAEERKVCLLGRSMLNIFEVANSIGYLRYKADTIIDINALDNHKPEELVLITTGSQGEPTAALSKIAFAEHKNVEIVEGDTIILSSSIIPGNEKPIYRMIDELYRRGADVIYASLADVHVSGHAYQEELKLIYHLARPKFFIPAHGEYRHLHLHSQMAQQMGHPKEKILLLSNGDILELNHNESRFIGFTEGAGVLIDGSGMGDVDKWVLRDRLRLAEDGVVSAFIAIDPGQNILLGQPDIIARGFIYDSEIESTTLSCRNLIEKLVAEAQAENKSLSQALKSGRLEHELRRLLFEKTRRRPVILISVIEIN